jgi:hypothetical protein
VPRGGAVPRAVPYLLAISLRATLASARPATEQYGQSSDAPAGGGTGTDDAACAVPVH